MIILDTNVLSELLRPRPEPAVVHWVASKPQSILFTTTITRAEVRYGIALMPEGKRKNALFSSIEKIFDEDFAGQVISFDNDAADCFAAIASARRGAGRPISHFDAMVAAITRSRGASLATRHGKDFVDCDVSLIDPWSASKRPSR